MNSNEISKALKAELQAEYPTTKFSVRKTRSNGWVGQVIEVRVNAGLEKADYLTICAIARLYDDACHQIEVIEVAA